MTGLPEYLRPSPHQLEAACRAYYDADEKAERLEREAAVARTRAERLRVAAMELCTRERGWTP